MTAFQDEPSPDVPSADPELAPSSPPPGAPVGRAPEDDLLVRVAEGDRQAFAALYDLVAARVLGLVRRVVVDHSQAEEVTQEVFLELWQSAGSFAPNKGRATTWILTLAHRRAVDRVRSAQASRDRDYRIGVRDTETGRDHVSEDAEVRLEHEKAARALAALSDAQREAIELAYYGGLSQSEISERLGVPLGTVKTRIRDGMSRLRDELGVRP